MEEFKNTMGDRIEYTKDRYEALIDAHALILITEWSEFRILNHTLLKKLMKDYVVFDGRNIYDPAEMKENGITYYGIGRNID
jgi:UDPglucose 6-dehydrogenase